MGCYVSQEQQEGGEQAQEAWMKIWDGGGGWTHDEAGYTVGLSWRRGFPPPLSHPQGPSPQGTAKMLQQKGQHPAQLRTDVCTPGGTTIYGLHALEQGGLRAATMSAVEAATCRARELSGK